MGKIDHFKVFDTHELESRGPESHQHIETLLWHIEAIHKLKDNSDKIDYIQDMSTGFQLDFTKACKTLGLQDTNGRCSPENIEDLQNKIAEDYPLLSKKFQKKKYQKTLKILTKGVKANSHRVIEGMIKEDKVSWWEVYACVSVNQAIERFDRMVRKWKSDPKEVEMAFNIFNDVAKEAWTYNEDYREIFKKIDIKTKIYLAKMHQQNRSFNISDLGIKLEDIPSKLLNIEDLWEKNIKDLYNTAPEAFIKRILDKGIWKRAFVGIINLCYKAQLEVFGHKSLFDKVCWKELKEVIINLKVKHISLLNSDIVSELSSEELFVRKYLKKYSNTKLAIKSLWITNSNIPAIFKILREEAPEAIQEIETHTLRNVPDEDMSEYLESLSAQKIDLQTAAQEKKVQITAENIINSKKKRPHKKSLKKHIKELNEKNQEIDDQILKIVSKLIDGHRNNIWDQVLDFCWDFLFKHGNFRNMNVKLLRRFFEANISKLMESWKIQNLKDNEFHYLVSKVLFPLLSYSYGRHSMKPGGDHFKPFMEMLIERTDIVSLHPIYLMWLVRKNYIPRIVKKLNPEQSLELANKLWNRVHWIDDSKEEKTQTDAYDALYPKVSQIKNWESKIKSISFVESGERRNKYEAYIVTLSNSEFIKARFICDKNTQNNESLMTKVAGFNWKELLSLFEDHLWGYEHILSSELVQAWINKLRNEDFLLILPKIIEKHKIINNNDDFISKICRMQEKNFRLVLDMMKEREVFSLYNLYDNLLTEMKERANTLDITHDKLDEVTYNNIQD